ncbi:MAG: hypothetical protein RMM58_14270 [Chloroflexota bacterium]|nr:hypothetical protein [Dehalococcoidia bacterium]MDW8255038.1 hypothetical protein [Chloroflexota bacterium]
MRRLVWGLALLSLAAIAIVGRERAEATDQARNLLKNGLFEEWVSWGDVTVGLYWAPWVVLGSPTFNRHGHEPGQQIMSERGAFVAGLYQEIAGVTPGAQYYGYVGSASLYWGNPEGRFEEVCRAVGIDPTGGTDPRSPEIVWGNVTCSNKRWDFKDDPNANAAKVRAVAKGPKVTFFLLAANLRGDNLAQVWFTDAAVLLDSERPSGTPTTVPAFGFRPAPGATPPPSVSATAIARVLGRDAAPTATVAASATPATAGSPRRAEPDFSLHDGGREIGRFYTQTARDGHGYAVVDRGATRWWSEFTRLGGIAALGYPISRPFTAPDGFQYQAFQRAVLQWRPERNGAVLANALDWLSDAGRDEWAFTRGIPRAIKDDGSNGDFARAVEVRLGWLTEPAIERRFREDPATGNRWSVEEAIARYGLPASLPEKSGPFIVQRFQRIAFQYWVEDAPGGLPRGTVVPLLAGDLLADAGLIPAAARQPEPPPA